MRHIADKGHPDADALRTAADAYEKASTTFHADRVAEAHAWELAQKEVETPEVSDLLTKYREAHRVLLTALAPKPGTAESWNESYE